MKLNAYFYNLESANKAANYLKNMGFRAYVDIIDKYADTYNDKQNIAGTDTGPTLASLVLKSGYPFDIRKSPLLMSDPMISGMGYYDETADANIQLNVEVTDDKTNDVVKVIKSFGGLT